MNRRNREKIEESRDQKPYNEELDNWPIIGSIVPEHMIGMVDQWRLEQNVDHAVAYIRKEIERLEIGNPDYADEEKGIQFKFLLDTMLKYSRTPEQITNMVNGYMNFCIRECGQFRNPILNMTRDLEITTINLNLTGHAKIEALKECFGDEKFKSLKEHSRNPVLDTVTHGFAKQAIYRYGNESFYDSAYFLMSDPDKVYYEEIDTEDNSAIRKTPEGKRMTKEKLARLLQIPNLEKFIIADIEMPGPAMASSLAIISEYFCENNDAIYANVISPKMISDWISEKFSKYNPPLEVAYYVWARFQQTEFEDVASFIESYIISYHEKNHPWIFEAAGEKPDASSKPGDLFKIYISAYSKLQENPADPNYQKLLEIMPDRGILFPFTKSKNPEYRKNSEAFLKAIKIPFSHVQTGYTKEKADEDQAQILIDILNEQGVPCNDWKTYEGFELLDPFAIGAMKYSLRTWAIGVMKENIIKGLDKMPLETLFVFRNIVVKNIKLPSFKKKLEEIILTLIDKAYGESISQTTSTELLIEIARGKEIDAQSLIPSISSLPPDMRRAPISQRLPELAEAALITRYFSDVRGGKEIVKFLIAHRYSMNPAELILPFPDAPNLEIIKIYKESPNLLLFLSMSTILMYLGYAYNEILAIIGELATRTEKDSRDELSTIGIEWEQVGGVNGKIIATDRFSELFNVLPCGNDRGCNEILSLPSTSAEAQSALMSLITNPANGYLNSKALWAAEQASEQKLSSIHVNIGLPIELGPSSWANNALTEPIIKATWLAHGGDLQSSMARSVTRGWKTDSLLDVLGNKDPRLKLEIKNLALEKDGSHNEELNQIFLIASACMQRAKELHGVKTSNAGSVMAGIFEAFKTEVDRLKFAPDEAEAAKRLLAEYSARVKAELEL